VHTYSISPLRDSRWDDLVAQHPGASVFHERGWLEALNRTYGFEPLVLTTTDAGRPLANGLVLCRVSSWITGNRLVSLPFSDHCEPLLSNASELDDLLDSLREECDRWGAKYFELRWLPCHERERRFLVPGESYCFHALDLTRPLEEIFARLHKDSIQRRIRRADRELSCEAGRSQGLVDEFYCRHHVPPQPRTWFQNLGECMGRKLEIWVARKNGVSIAAMLTLRHGSTVVYKYGGSDPAFHHVGGMPYLFWKVIAASKQSGATELDFGRSDLNNQGLITFKDRFGTARKVMTYFRYPPADQRAGMPAWVLRSLGRVMSMLPTAVMPFVGRIMYRHIG
jgi:Acetyltransferase (GNAT) domain